jgi:hypothetical protein
VKQGSDLTTGGTDDLVAQILSPLPATYEPPSHVTIVQSRLANGKFQRGVAVGLEIAAQATKLSGLTTSFLLATTGAYGGAVPGSPAPRPSTRSRKARRRPTTTPTS